MRTREAQLSTVNSHHQHIEISLNDMDQNQADSAEACQRCGQDVSAAGDCDNQRNASPALQIEGNTSGLHQSNESSGAPVSKHVLVHGTSRLGRLFLGSIAGDRQQRRLKLSTFIDTWTETSKQEFGVKVVVVRTPRCIADHLPHCRPIQPLPA
jgi:hypothetical protein